MRCRLFCGNRSGGLAPPSLRRRGPLRSPPLRSRCSRSGASRPRRTTAELTSAPMGSVPLPPERLPALNPCRYPYRYRYRSHYQRPSTKPHCAACPHTSARAQTLVTLGKVMMPLGKIAGVAATISVCVASLRDPHASLFLSLCFVSLASAAAATPS